VLTTKHSDKSYGSYKANFRVMDQKVIQHIIFRTCTMDYDQMLLTFKEVSAKKSIRCEQTCLNFYICAISILDDLALI